MPLSKRWKSFESFVQEKALCLIALGKIYDQPWTSTIDSVIGLHLFTTQHKKCSLNSCLGLLLETSLQHPCLYKGLPPRFKGMHLAIIWAQHNIFKPSFCYLLLCHDHYRSLIHLLLDGALPLETFCVCTCECCDTLLAEEQVATLCCCPYIQHLRCVYLINPLSPKTTYKLHDG